MLFCVGLHNSSSNGNRSTGVLRIIRDAGMDVRPEAMNVTVKDVKDTVLDLGAWSIANGCVFNRAILMFAAMGRACCLPHFDIRPVACSQWQMRARLLSVK